MSKEIESWSRDYLLLGWDECGYGSFFGDMFMGGAIFPKGFDFDSIPGLTDSKKLTDKKRFHLETLIKEQCLYWVVLQVSPQDIDAGSSYHLKLNRMSQHLHSGLIPHANIDVIFDGNAAIPNPPPGISSTCLEKGDLLVKTISAASVLAKCAQRRQMMESALTYPEYGLDKNSGYHSPGHVAAIKSHGPTPLHRLTYIKNFYKV